MANAWMLLGSFTILGDLSGPSVEVVVVVVVDLVEASMIGSMVVIPA